MSPEELASALQQAGGDVEEVRAVVRRASVAMRDAGADRLGLAEVLMTLAGHDNGRVRQDVAEISDLFPAPFFDRAYDALSGDSDYYAKQAMKRATERMVVRKKAQAKVDERGQELASALDDMERKHGRAARRSGERLARLGGADQVGRLRHELARAADALGHALSAFESEAGKPHPVPAALRDHGKRTRDRFEHVVAVLRNTSAPAKAARPSYRREHLRQIVEESRDAVVCAGVDVAIDVDYELELEADGVRLRQAIENVLKNAVDAQRGRPGAVRVSTRTLRKGVQIELVVEDAGVGMDAEECARLFVPFASKKPGGTGVGMTTVKAIVEEIHRGELEVTSVKGEGTRVVMRLPARQVRV